MFDNLGGIARVLSNRNAAVYLAGMFVSLNGSFVYTVALGWLTWELTGSPGWVGTIVLAETLPNAILAPIAGAIVDRGRPLRILLIAQLAQGTSMTALTLLTLLGRIDIALLLLFAASQGVFNGVSVPAHFACIPKLVPRRELSAALAMQSACAQSARFIGPAIAGGFLVALGPGAAFAFNAASYVLYALALALVRVDDRPAPGLVRAGLIGDMAEGFAYVRDHAQTRLLLMIAVCAALLLRPVLDLMPAYVGDVLAAGPAELAWLLSVAGGSALAATLWLARRGETAGLTRMMLAGFGLAAAAVIAFAAHGGFVIGVALIGVYGFASSVLNLGNMTLLQVGLDDRLRARVMGLFSLTHRAVPAVGAFLVGQIAGLATLQATLVGTAALSVLFWLWVRGPVRRRDFEAPPDARDQGEAAADEARALAD